MGRPTVRNLLDRRFTAASSRWAWGLPDPAYATFCSFSERDERDKSLPAMGLAAYGSKKDFRYGSGPTTG